ncbi:hypothetical protein KIPB_013336, partial [Kipferlia bialata]
RSVRNNRVVDIQALIDDLKGMEEEKPLAIHVSSLDPKSSAYQGGVLMVTIVDKMAVALYNRSGCFTVSVDGVAKTTHQCEGTLLMASSLTPTNRIFPMAYTWASTESGKSVGSLLGHLKPHLEKDPKYVITDGADCLRNATEAVFPDTTKHLLCAFHILLNFRTHLGTTKDSVFWELALSTTEEGYMLAADKIEALVVAQEAKALVKLQAKVAKANDKVKKQGKILDLPIPVCHPKPVSSRKW